IVIGWRKAPHLMNCLRAVAASVRRIRYEVILVLNEADRELVIEIERQVSGVRLLKTRVNLGFGGCVNFAAGHAEGAFILLLNDDTEVDAEWLETIVDTAHRRPNAGAVGSTMLFPDGTIQEAGSVVWADGSTLTVGRGRPGDAKIWDYERRVDYCSGGSLLIRKASFDRLGGLDEAYFPAYYEEADFCLRLADVGEEVWYSPRSRVRHLESASTNETFRSFLFARNRAVFVSHFPAQLAEREPADPLNDRAIARAVWRACGGRRKILLIDDQVAEPWIGSGYPRMAETVAELVDAGYDLSIFTSLIDGHERNDAMCALGVAVLDGFVEDDLEGHLADPVVPYSAVVISRPHNYERFAPIIRRCQPDLPIVYDAEALFSRRLERQAEMAGDEGARAMFIERAAAMRVNEAAIAADADRLVAISEVEAAILRETARGPVDLHGPLLSGIHPTSSGFWTRTNIGFVAGWAAGTDSPNFDALLWFARWVMPVIRARVPTAKLIVTGTGPPAQALRLSGPSVEFVGSVENLAAFDDQVRVVVVPMRYGAGVKIKTIEALQYGVPVVATEVGAEGVPLDDRDALLVTDDSYRFGLRVATLLDDPDAWSRQRSRVLEQGDRWEDERPESIWRLLIDDVIAAGRISAFQLE
ncbi:MAG TPA: glycosyltransferase, partial [Acidimicrobiales bacterium]|nr:glycosyltransferase [Acidimicrobiales bacterium]